MTDYLTLAIGAPRRLAILKRAADKLIARIKEARQALHTQYADYI